MVSHNIKTIRDKILEKSLPRMPVGPSGKTLGAYVKEYHNVLEKQKVRVKNRFPELAEKSNLEVAVQLALKKALENSHFYSQEEFRSFAGSYIRTILIDSLAYYTGKSVPGGKDFSQEGLDKKQQRYFKSFLRKLPGEDRLIMMLFYYEEMSSPEVAATLEKQEQYIKKRYELIIERLKGGMMILADS